MFKRLHRQLTIVSTVITGIITALVMLAALRISENGLIRNHYGTFLSNVSSCVNYIDNQKEIPIDWLSRMEFNYQFLIHIEDTGKEFLFSELRTSPDRKYLFQEARKKAEAENLIQFTPTNSGRISFQEITFTLALQNQSTYYASIYVLPKDMGYLTVMIMHPLQDQIHQITQQRLLFGGLFLLAIFLLFTFSWFFIRKVLRPVEENRKKQIEFVASASHELRTPLAVILANVSALDVSETDTSQVGEIASKAHDRAEKFGHEHRQFFSHIRNACKRMSRLINDMLLLASADSGSWSIKRSFISLDTLLLDVFETYDIIAKKKTQILEIHLPDENIPPCFCDRERIFQALSIILDNAIEYTPPNGHIYLKLKYIGQRFEICISDSGPGIPDEDKEKIFNRFYQSTVPTRNSSENITKNNSNNCIDTTTAPAVNAKTDDADNTKKDHFGLGLCIASEIIQIHHGTLSVTDTIGGGSTFIIRLKKS